MAEVSKYQQIDVAKIKKFFETIHAQTFEETADGAERLAPQIIELCDLVEGSTLLEDAAEARQRTELLDAPIQNKSQIIHDAIADLDPEDVLPGEY